MSEWRRLSGSEKESRIEEATQWAQENGGDDDAITSAAQNANGGSYDDIDEIKSLIRSRLQSLFG